MELHEDGILDEYGVEILGTDLLAINRAEDRELFRELMQQIGEPVPHSRIVHTVEEAVEYCQKLGYPVVVRPAYTLAVPAEALRTMRKSFAASARPG